MKLTNYEEFLLQKEEVYNLEKREEVHKKFPYIVCVKGCYPELDNTTRWCWRNFGPENTNCCYEYCSEYPGCELVIATGIKKDGYIKYKDPGNHSHEGRWEKFWLGKTDYDFGYAEFCFENESDAMAFKNVVEYFSFGEFYDDAEEFLDDEGILHNHMLNNDVAVNENGEVFLSNIPQLSWEELSEDIRKKAAKIYAGIRLK